MGRNLGIQIWHHFYDLGKFWSDDLLTHNFDLEIGPVDQIIKCWWPLDIVALYVTYSISKYVICNIFHCWVNLKLAYADSIG